MGHAMKMRIGIAAMIAAVAFRADAQPEPKIPKAHGCANSREIPRDRAAGKKIKSTTI
jgi:hypothetical protein